MDIGIGVVLICVASMFITWLVFGKNLTDTRTTKFLYWIKSSVFMGVLVFAWMAYKEPALGFVPTIAIAMALSGFVNLVRSQWVFLFP
ncbi:hypothetical protein K7G19_23080 [Cupriavidus sp. DB3]|uniref:hypothetical protein n=1 Tax=Cupriavidus sp. DB3 TaxID=2873259 RepID=UPI001CF117D3|nr:hypothetical protein [Cupriavidus sp. DB3]MCA7086483.1 hypothetical protein [Cupriavidus sp. DB3]